MNSKAKKKLFKALKGSDDFSKHNKKMIEASEGLIKSGKCSLKEFEEMGGWMRSTNRGSGVYFAYCADTKVYLNVITGKVSN
jgi:hypothetical protein